MTNPNVVHEFVLVAAAYGVEGAVPLIVLLSRMFVPISGTIHKSRAGSKADAEELCLASALSNRYFEDCCEGTFPWVQTADGGNYQPYFTSVFNLSFTYLCLSPFLVPDHASLDF